MATYHPQLGRPLCNQLVFVVAHNVCTTRTGLRIKPRTAYKRPGGNTYQPQVPVYQNKFGHHVLWPESMLQLLATSSRYASPWARTHILRSPLGPACRSMTVRPWHQIQNTDHCFFHHNSSGTSLDHGQSNTVLPLLPTLW